LNECFEVFLGILEVSTLSPAKWQVIALALLILHSFFYYESTTIIKHWWLCISQTITGACILSFNMCLKFSENLKSH
jgi:hypothetical protein